jgi:predicted Rossmann fold flavoprotein
MSTEIRVKLIYDVAIIGGGPAGLMAAGRASSLGAKVIILEKNATLGVKLLITGGGRCNVTNAQFDVRTFLKKYKDSDKFLFSAFSQFSVKDTLEFFNGKGMPTKVEAENRVFPVSDSSQSVWDVLVDTIKQNNVEVRSNAVVTGFDHENKKITAINLKNGGKVLAKKIVLATGGTSRPETGSTGDGFIWLKDLGHNVVDSNEALVPIAISDKWVKELSGLTLQDIKLTTFQNNTKQQSHKGKLLFTHFGISGPTILNMSKDIGELLKYGEVIIKLDILPHFDHGMMNTRLQELFKIDDKKKIKNSLDSLIPSGLVDIVLKLSNIDKNKNNNSVSREERLKLIDIIKNIPMNVDSLLGSDKAVVSSGGVDLTEVDFKTMQSKIIENLYLVGDVLNIDRPSGGYSLQLCWTTGFVAGNSVIAK